ncbi:MAG: phosphotransferase [Isosphaeraceae bacterium]
MFRWVTSEDERSSHRDGGGVLVRVATKDPGPVVVCLALETGGAAPPALSFRIVGGSETVVEPEEGPTHLTVRYVLVFAVTPDGPAEADWESVGDLEGPGVPPCRVVVRRSGGRVVSALVGRGVKPYQPEPEVEAALRWHAWGRASELVALKRFETGRGGGEVTVIRPRLRAPSADLPSLESSGPPEVADGAPGSCWLVKSGSAAKIRREWDRFREYLVDRAHPFLARCESFVSVRPPGQAEPPGTAVLFSTFVGGGDLLRPEPLEEVLRGPVEPERLDRLIDRIFTVLGPWSHASRPHPLARWRRVFRGNENDWLLFGKFDLSRKRRTEPKGPQGRREFTAGLDWDIAFLEEDHLSKHLLGRQRNGLLHRLREVEAGYSLTHGDLNPRNVLCEGDDVWLIDFEYVGVAPTLADHARLEVNLRLWCLKLGPTDANIEDVAAAIETRLLDHFLGNTGNLGMLGELSGDLDVAPQNLLNVARAIARIRGHASQCLSRCPDRRDYLSVLLSDGPQPARVRVRRRGPTAKLPVL